MESSSAALLELLLRGLEIHERATLLSELEALDRRIEALPSDTAFDERRLAAARQMGSESLFGLKQAMPRLAADGVRARDNWANANALVVRLTHTNTPLTLDAVRALNAAVLGAEAASPLRAYPTTIGPEPAPPPQDVASLLAPMLEQMTQRAHEFHPIASAALLYQWIVSVHPFEDGNGRTSRLAADWMLAVAGYPPMSFADRQASLLTLFASGPTPLSVAESVRVVSRAIEHTLTCCTRAPGS